MNKSEEEYKLHLHPRPKESILLEIPKDTLDSLKKIAQSRDMSLEALLRFYIGQGLRLELAKVTEDQKQQSVNNTKNVHNET